MNTKYQKSLLLFLLLILLPVLTSGCSALRQTASLIPGPDFEELAYVDLSSQSFDQAGLGQFTLEETADVTLRYILPNVDTSTFDLSLITPDGENLTILHSEDYRTDASGGGTWQHNLAPGTYQVILTASQGAGDLSVYWKSQ